MSTSVLATKHYTCHSKEAARDVVGNFLLTLLRFKQSCFGRITSTLCPKSSTARERLVTTSPRPPTCDSIGNTISVMHQQNRNGDVSCHSCANNMNLTQKYE